MTPMQSAVRVPIVGDDREFQRAIDRSQARLVAFKNGADQAVARVARIGVVAAAAAITAGGAMATIVGRSLETVDAQAKLARQLGTTSESIGVLSRAATLSGTSLEELQRGLVRQNAVLGEAARGAGTGAQALELLGLRADALIALPLDERLALIARRMDEMNLSAAAQADLLNKLGDSRGRMFNLLENGAAVLQRATREAEAFGLAVSDVDAAAIEAANDAMSSIGAVVTGVGNRIAIDLAPVLEKLAMRFSDAAEKSKGFKQEVDGAFDGAVRGVVTFLDVAGRATEAIASNPLIGPFGLIGLILWGKKGAVAAGLAAEVVKRVAQATGLMEETASSRFETIERRIRDRRAALTEPLGPTMRRDVESDLERLLDERRSLLEKAGIDLGGMPASLDEIQAKLRDNTGEAGGFGRALQGLAAELRGALEAAREAEGDFPDPLDEEGVAAEGPRGGGMGGETATDKREREKMERERERLTEKADMLYLSLLTEEEAEFESYRRRLEALEEYRDAEILLEEEFDAQAAVLQQRHEREITRIREQAQRERAQKLGQLLTREQQETLSTLESMTGAVAQHNRAMFALNKAAAIANTIISTHAGAAKALEWGWPLGPIFAGLMYAAGAARVAQIASTSFGGGTAPSAAATPAPAVTPVGAQAAAGSPGGGGSGGSQVSISLVGESFGRDQVRGLIERINEAVSDGAVLRVA